jgi:hypothetical protein
MQKLREWINQGAHWPESDADRAAATDKRLQHWSFQALAKPAAHADIDALVESKLRASGLGLSPEADRRTLMRRLYLDVLGLPPERSELEAFIADKSANSYDKLVERVLESPRFGERQARHWLDVARYAESRGKETNLPYPHAWRDRDWVIASFNADKPYDSFLKEQICGDMLGADAATGFITASRVSDGAPLLSTAALAFGPVAAFCLADALFPVPLARSQQLSTSVEDRIGRPLRVFPSSDGMWRLPARAGRPPSTATCAAAPPPSRPRRLLA